MRQRLLALCLFAYPRVRRERDRDYLRDLALDLSETYGLRRQALSLLRGGLLERLEGPRLRPGAGHRGWVKLVVVACSALAVLGFAAGGLGVLTRGERIRVEADRFTCVETDHPGPGRDRIHVAGPSLCAAAERVLAARRREGWDCATLRRASDGRRAISWRCALRQGRVERSAL